MKCTSVESAFSAIHEQTLPAGRARSVRDHLARCARCAAGYAAFGEALQVLHAVGPSETEPRVRAAILAAVDRAASKDAAAGDEAFRRSMTLAAGRVVWRERRLRRTTQVLAALLGVAAVWLGILGTRLIELRADRSEEVVAPLRAPIAAAPVGLRWSGPAARLERGPTSVPVRARDELTLQEGDRLVGDGVTISMGEGGALAVSTEAREVIVEERVVRVPVEVRVVETVDRLVEVERGPLFQWEARLLTRFAADVVSVLEHATFEPLAAEQNASPKDAPLASVKSEAAPLAQTQVLEASEGSATLGRVPESTLSVWVEDGTVSLSLSGALEDQVDTLWSRLADPDENVAAAARRCLQSIRRRVEQDPALGPRLARVEPAQDSWVGVLSDRDAPDEPTWSEEWRTWWEKNHALVASVEGASF